MITQRYIYGVYDATKKTISSRESILSFEYTGGGTRLYITTFEDYFHRHLYNFV